MSFKFTIVPTNLHPGPTHPLIRQGAVNAVVKALENWRFMQYPGKAEIQVLYDVTESGSLTFVLDFVHLDEKLQEKGTKLVSDIIRPTISENMYSIHSVDCSFGKETHLVSINDSYKSGIFYGASYLPDAPEDAKIPISSIKENSHKSLVENSERIISNKKGFELFLTALKAREYNKALRRLCTSTAPEVSALVCLMLNAKETLGIDINERAGEHNCNALHYAAKNKYFSVYNQLIMRGADITLVNKEGLNGVQVLEREIEKDKSKRIVGKKSDTDVKTTPLENLPKEKAEELSNNSLTLDFIVINNSKLSLDPEFSFVKGNFDFWIDIFCKKVAAELEIPFKFLRISFERDYCQITKAVKCKFYHIPSSSFSKLKLDLNLVQNVITNLIKSNEQLQNFFVLKDIEPKDKDVADIDASLFNPTDNLKVHYKRDYFGNLLETTYMATRVPSSESLSKFKGFFSSDSDVTKEVGNLSAVHNKNLKDKKLEVSETNPSINPESLEEEISKSSNLAVLLKIKYKQNTVNLSSIFKALCYACAKNYHEDLPILLSTGIDINKCVEGSLNMKLPLHWAVTSGSVECAQLLLQAGAKTDIKDKTKTAKEYAEISNNTGIHAIFGIKKETTSLLRI